MYTVTPRRVHETIVTSEKEYVLHSVCVCSLSYTACHEPYYIVICDLSGCAKFIHII